MIPQEQQRLQACISEIAQILYNNTPKEKITTLEGIEKAVGQQMMELENVSFLLQLRCAYLNGLLTV